MSTHPIFTGQTRRVLMQLRWGDMDAYGHINNVSMVRLLEESRIRILGSPTAARDAADTSGHASGDDSDDAALRILDRNDPSIQVLVAAQRIEYRAQLKYRPGPVAIDIGITKIGAANFTVAYAVREPGDGAVYALAEVDLVYVDAQSGRPVRLPTDTAQAVAAIRNDPLPLKRR